MARARSPPVDRVRVRLAREVGAALAAKVPDGYQRLGHVLVVRVPADLWPHRRALGAAWCAELGVDTVLARTGTIEGELREPSVETIAGRATETEVVEHGVRWRFDAVRVMFAMGNRTERQRVRTLVRAGERVADLFAGIGYFAVPAALADPTVRVTAVEKNPVSYRYLVTNARLNGVADRLEPVEGDNRSVELPPASFDRIFLGWLPDATPWLDRALVLAGPGPAWLHLHRVADVREPLSETAAAVLARIAGLGRKVLPGARAREVKPYGPGRRHVVVDVPLAPV
jgi:tRNA wybutosine-synthesizing protein 2